MNFVYRCELYKLGWGRIGETVKEPASLEVPYLRRPGTVGVWTLQLEALKVFSLWKYLDGEEWAGDGSVSSRRDQEGQMVAQSLTPVCPLLEPPSD